MRIGTNELLIILVVVLLIFGPKNLPKLARCSVRPSMALRRAWRTRTRAVRGDCKEG